MLQEVQRRTAAKQDCRHTGLDNQVELSKKTCVKATIVLHSWHTLLDLPLQMSFIIVYTHVCQAYLCAVALNATSWTVSAIHRSDLCLHAILSSVTEHAAAGFEKCYYISEQP